MKVPKWVDEYMVPRGRCGVCGCPDARHRMLDAIYARVKAGEPAEDVADDYELPRAFVERVANEWRA